MTVSKKISLWSITIVLFFSGGLCNSFAFSFFGGGFKSDVKNEIKETFVGEKILIFPQLNKLNTGYFKIQDKNYYYIKTISKIFFQDEPVKASVAGVDFSKDGVSVELWNDLLGRGSIRFFIDKEFAESIKSHELINAIKLCASGDKEKEVVLNKKSKIYHLKWSNHLPKSELSKIAKLDEVKNHGYKECGFCFKSFLYLPDFDIERSLARAAKSNIYFLSMTYSDQNAISKVKTIGQKVLSRWPTKLIGYQYNFHVIDSSEINSFAIPGGDIYVTSSMIGAVESDEELEAILVHEVAHVEKRHALKSFETLKQKLAQQQFMAAAGAAAAGVAAANNNYDTSSVVLASTLGGLILLENYYSGYSKDLEEEADRLANYYFTKNGLNILHLESVYNKLKFLNLCAYQNPDPKTDSHPYLSDRLTNIRNIKMLDFATNNTYVLKLEKAPTLVVNLLSLEKINDKEILTVYIDDSSFFKNYSAVAMGNFSLMDSPKINQITLKNGEKKRRYYLNSFDKKFITQDTWGAFLILTRSVEEGDIFDMPSMPDELSLSVTVHDTELNRTTHKNFTFSKK